MKTAILVVSFGTSYEDTLKKNISALENDIKECFGDYEVRRAFTSGFIINKLKTKMNIEIDNVETALDKLSNEGYEKVICQPTHIMNGFEYEKFVKMAESKRNLFKDIVIGEPLLFGTEDNQNIVDCLKNEFKEYKESAIVFMGHGTEHPSNSIYAAIDYMMKDRGFENGFMGTVEGYPEIESVVNTVKRNEYKNIILTPFMLVAGDHANNDMTGEEDSWENIFINQGFNVKCIVKGLGEYKSIRNLYIDKLKKLI